MHIFSRRRPFWLAFLAVGLVGASGAAQAAVQSGIGCDAPGIAAAAPRILIDVTGIRHPGGNVTFTLYGSDPARFLHHHGKIGLIRVPVTGTTAQGCFAVSGPGTYAVAVYDDANDNHRFDLTLVGLPAEDWGFSNNPHFLLAPPGLHATAFPVGAGETRIEVTLHS